MVSSGRSSLISLFQSDIFLSDPQIYVFEHPASLLSHNLLSFPSANLFFPFVFSYSTCLFRSMLTCLIKSFGFLLLPQLIAGNIIIISDYSIHNTWLLPVSNNLSLPPVSFNPFEHCVCRFLRLLSGKSEKQLRTYSDTVLTTHSFVCSPFPDKNHSF